MGRVMASARELERALEAHRARGERIVSTNGVFDILHVGHARYLQAARALGDVLVVGINSDASTRALKGPDRPFVGEEERAELVAALACVDYTIIFGERTPDALLAVVRPTTHVKGGDYRAEDLPEAAVVRRYGGDVRTVSFIPGRSTTGLAERIAAGAQAEHAADTA